MEGKSEGIVLDSVTFELIQKQIGALHDALLCMEDLAEIASADAAVHRNLPVAVSEMARSCRSRCSFVGEELRRAAPHRDSIPAGSLDLS